MADIYKLQGTIEVNTGKADASLKKVESSARGTQAALNRIDGRKAGSQIASGFDRGAQSASRLMSVVNNLQAKINSMRGASVKFGSSGGVGGGGLGAIAGGNLLSGAISAATGGLTDKLKQGWSAGIEYNKMLEKANISFTTLLGSTAKAQEHLSKLQAFGEATPFEFGDLIKASQRMQAMGFDAQSIIPTLKNVGDAVSAVGGGKEELDGVVTALGQMKTKGKISSEEMNQLAERGIPAWDLLAKAIGKTKQETIELAGQGRIGGGAAEGIVAMMGERFGGQMDKMSATLEGQESNFNDVLNRQLGAATAGNFDQLKQTYKAATQGLGTEGAKTFGTEIKSMLDQTGKVAMGDLSKLASGEVFKDGAKVASGVSSVAGSLGDAGKAFSAGNYYDAAAGVGAAIGKGLEMGLKNSQDPIDRAVYDFFSGIITQSKSILGIQSPSKVYEEIGVNTVAGFGLGLEAGKKKLGSASVVDAEKLRAATLAELEKLRDDPRIKAMLDTIAKAEGTGASYNMQFGGGKFSDMSAHPNEAITRKMGGKSITSTAAGRYQFLNRTWSGLEGQLGLSDFGAKSQDLGAIALMKQRGMIDPILKGDISGALTKGNREWASLPGSPYGQPTKSAEVLTTAYNAALEKYNAAAATAAPATSLLSSALDYVNTKMASVTDSAMKLGESLGIIGAKPSGPSIGKAVPRAGQIGVGSIGGVEIKSGADKITLSKDAATASTGLATMQKTVGALPAPITEATKAIGDNATQAGKWASEIKLASDKTGEATKEMIDHFARFKDSFASGIDDMLENGFSKDGLKAMGKNLLKDLSGGLISQATGGKASSVGGLLSNALFGGGGTGGPFTGGFAGGPGAGGVLGGGGIGGQVKSSLMSGVTGKIGGWLGKVPGLGKLFGGGASAAAGATGQAAAGAGGMLGKIGGFLGLGGPAGLVAGIGLSLGASLFGKLFGGDPLKDYKKHVKSEYGVSISNQMAAKIQQIGQSKFGAEAAKRKIETVRLPEVRDMLSEYAGAFQKGGNNKLFSGAEVGDQFSAMNQFKVPMMANGGFLRAGQLAIIGERGPELFAPSTSGRVIPNEAGMGGGMEAMGDMLDRLASALNRFQSMPADQVVMTGARSNPDIITDAVDRSLGSRSDSAVRMRDKLQYR